MRLDERVRLLRLLGRRGLAGADRPDGLVGDHEAGSSPAANASASTWRLSTSLGLARLALGLERLADARDHAEARVERGARAPRDRLVGLAEVLAALGVADDRAVRRRARAASAPRPRR